MGRFNKIVQVCIGLALLVTACAPQATPPTIMDVEQAVQTVPTLAQRPASTAALLSEDANSTPEVKSNASVPPTPQPTDVLALIGTPLANRIETIGVENFTRLKRIGQWGRGSILGVAFTPNGSSFIAISELGWSIYNMNALDQPPQWVAFDEPAIFNKFTFSKDGTILKFIEDGYPSNRIFYRSFPSGTMQTDQVATDWLIPDGMNDYRGIQVASADGTRVFKGTLEYGFDEVNFTEEKAVRRMYDGNDQLLYDFRDPAPYVTYEDRNGPEGCDLSVFSPCGNALMALATSTTKALFSSDGRTMSALYEPTSLYSGLMRNYSYIRIYNSANGDLLGSLGGFSQPVQDFDYSPDGKLLVVGFVDGSIILWDIAAAKSIYGARHMNAPGWRYEYSHDGKYLLIQRAGELEVRLTTNGALVYRFGMADFAISPNKNWVALGSDTGTVQVRDLDSGEEVLNFKAHDARIYSLAFSPDGYYLASSGQDCNIKLWELATGKLLHYFEETAVDAYELGMTSRVFSTYLEFVPGQNMLIGFGSWGTVVNWNVNSGATNYVIQSSALEYYNGMITIKPHFPEFFDVDNDTSQFFINENSFNLATGENLGVYEPPKSLPNGCAPIGPLSADKNLLFTRGYGHDHAGEVCILDPQNFNLLGTIKVIANDEDDAWMDWLYMSPDGRQLIVTVGSGIIYVYQIVP